MISKIGLHTSLALLIAMTGLSALIKYRLAQTHNVDVPVEKLAMNIGEWQGREAGELEATSQGILQLNRYVRRLYSAPASPPIFVYIGYWEKQTGDYQAAKHSPNLCLPANGWQIERLGAKQLTLSNGTSITVNRLIGDFRGKKSLVYYWFFNGTEFYHEEWQSLLRISTNALFGQRTDGGIVELSTPISANPDGSTNYNDVEAKSEALVQLLSIQLTQMLSKS